MDVFVSARMLCGPRWSSVCSVCGLDDRKVVHTGCAWRSLTLYGCSGRPISSLGRGSTGPRRGKGRVKMRKFQILGVALVAVFAFGVITAASASAAPTFLLAEWLVNGATFTGELEVESVGTILLEDTATGVNVICSGILDGLISENGLDRISDVLTLNGVTTISLVPLTEPSVEGCTTMSPLCSEPLVWPLHLPWDTQVELMEEPAGTFLLFVVLVTESATGGGLPGWYVICMKTIGEPVDQCTAKENGVIDLSLELSLLLGQFSDPLSTEAGEKLATCTLGSAESGVVETIPSEILLTGGGTISASSEAGAVEA